jgi:hypothetical protein
MWCGVLNSTSKQLDIMVYMNVQQVANLHHVPDVPPDEEEEK